MKRQGFTLVELLVVIAIIALLMGILMPALARVRQLAFRLTCGTNLSGIGKAMLIYANDYDNELPRAGGKDAELLIIIARDSTVEKNKGRKPIISENQRRALVESLKVVDEAVLGFENFDMGNVIKRVKPDVIALGYDQTDMGTIFIF